MAVRSCELDEREITCGRSSPDERGIRFMPRRRGPDASQSSTARTTWNPWSDEIRIADQEPSTNRACPGRGRLAEPLGEEREQQTRIRGQLTVTNRRRGLSVSASGLRDRGLSQPGRRPVKTARRCDVSIAWTSRLFLRRATAARHKVNQAQQRVSFQTPVASTPAKLRSYFGLSISDFGFRISDFGFCPSTPTIG